MSLNNIDDLLIKVQKNDPVEPLSEVEPENIKDDIVQTAKDEVAQEEEEKLSHLEQFRKDKEEFLSKTEPENAENLQNTPEDSQKNENDVKDRQDIDEYGNKIIKSKTYTEEEVQAMIRKRLKLHHEEKAQQQQYQPPPQQPQEEFQHDQFNDQPWEVQLESHIKQTVQKLENEKAQVAWQQEEQRSQAEFESRFTSGMSKYSDFSDVVSGKPITNGIMMAARSMDDPAAFIYAVAKQQPKELERISQIRDPYVLATEVGRLEERMKKARTVSKAPKPIAKTRGDMADRGAIKQNIDDLIRQDAKRKLGRR